MTDLETLRAMLKAADLKFTEEPLYGEREPVATHYHATDLSGIQLAVGTLLTIEGPQPTLIHWPDRNDSYSGGETRVHFYEDGSLLAFDAD